MSGPVAHVGKVQTPAIGSGLPDLGGWEALQKAMLPAIMPDPYRPDDLVLLEMARYAKTTEGMRFFSWLRGVSHGAPYPQHIGTIEQTALAAAKHQGRCIVGELVSHAIAEGERLRALKG